MSFSGTFDGVDLNAGNYHIMYAGTSTLAQAPARTTITPYATLPRSGRLPRAAGPLVLPYAIRVDGLRSDGTLGGRLDTLMELLGREGKRLTGSFQDLRWVTATWFPGGPIGLYPNHAIVTGQFHAEESYFQAPAPSANIQTGALGTLPLEAFETGTAWGYTLSLTPGGGAPTPLRALFAVTGANTPTRFSIRNKYTAPPEALTVSATVAAGNLVAFDPVNELVWQSAQTDVRGYWPFADASGSALDFSTNSRDLTAVGGISYLSDGPEFGACDFNGSTGEFTSSDANFALVTNITIMGWVYAGVLGTLMGAFGKGANLGGYAVYKTAGDVFAAGVGSGAATRIATGTTPVTAGRWYHLAMVFDDTANSVTLYLDGELEAQATGGAFTVGGYSGDLKVGSVRDLTATVRFWTGRITGVAVIANTLTQAQVRRAMAFGLAAYNGTHASAEPGIWPQLHGENSAATDLVDVRLTHATAAPAGRLALGWRAAYPVAG